MQPKKLEVKEITSDLDKQAGHQTWFYRGIRMRACPGTRADTVEMFGIDIVVMFPRMVDRLLRAEGVEIGNHDCVRVFVEHDWVQENETNVRIRFIRI